MADILSKTTFNTKYKDDFKDSDNYHRILFNAGKALQARELTQMQTITQREITRLGNNLFNDGSVVRAGNVTLDNRYEFVKITGIPAGYSGSDYVGKTLTTDNNIKVEVLEYTSTPSQAFYVKYLDTESGTSSENPVRVSASSVLSGTGVDDVTVLGSGTFVGAASRISVDNGDYFVQGRFVFVEKQTIFLDKFDNTPTAVVGFKLVEDLVSIDDTNELYDNQGAVPNLAAPGADRYRIRLTLVKQSDVASDENFVYLCKIENGKIIDQSTYDDAYNKINDVLALRTKEESGDYVVQPFRARFNTLDDSNLQLEVSNGIAYVDGYRLDIPSTKITVPKAQEILDSANQTIIAQYGNFLVGNASDNNGLPNIDSCQLVNLRDATDYGGNTLGTARVRAIEENNDGNYKFSLFDISLDSATVRFSDVRSFGTDANDVVNVVLDGGDAVLKNTANNSLLFPLPQSRPQNVTITGLTVQRRYAWTTGSGITSKTINSTDDGYSAGTFTNSNDWVLATTSGTIITSATYGTLTDQVTISGLTQNTSYELIVYVTITTPSTTSKLLNTGETVTKTWPTDAESDGTGLTFLQLTHPDIYKLNHVRKDDASGADLASNFYLDNGQRDNFYARGRLLVKSGASIPNGSIHISYDHFSINTKGDFFSVNSYDNQVDYENIPSYTKNNNETISLRDVLDFRPVQNASGGYDQTTVHALPQTTDAITGAATYYLPRKDRLVASVERSRDGRVGKGTLKVIRGVSDLDPQFPAIPTSSLPLYDLSLNAYTLNESDMTTEFYDNKRFTMRDIGNLEKRIDDLFELTTLNFLETNTATFAVVDSAGNPRTKAGFIADGFSNYSFSAVEREEYRAQIDPLERTLSPEIVPNNVRLFYDSSLTLDAGQEKVSHKGDFLLLPIDSNVSYINQDLATEAININPYHVITNTGILDLSPQSDTWVETRYATDRVIDGGTVTRNVAGRTVNNLNTWRSSWFGSRSGDRVQVITGSRTLRSLVGDRVIDVQVIPFMRSIKVFFKANGLRPNTKHFPFMGGSRISDYAREETFKRVSTTNKTKVFTNRTSHPSGSTDLISDSNGTITGSFIIPSNNDLKFRTGSQEVKLLDITADNDNNALSKARRTFTSSGTLETRQRTIRSTRQLDIATFRERQSDPPDPLAQTFRVDQIENPNGLFITKLRLYFKTISSINPVFVQIRTVENGIPTDTVIPGAQVVLTAAEVNSQWTSAGSTSEDVRTNSAVDFEFEEPVFLNSGQEYAIVILSDSLDYEVYVAKTYEFLLGSTEARVTKQPTLGVLFKSQNARTWTPDQERDLMFNLFRAEFATTGQAILQNDTMPEILLAPNPLLTDSGSDTIRVFHEGHGLSKGDKVTISGLDSDTTYGGIAGHHIKGHREVLNVDHTGYTFQADSIASSGVRVGGDSVEVTQNAIMNSYFPSIATLLPETTSLSSSVRLTGSSSGVAQLSYAENRNTNNLALSKATDYSAITINEFITNEEPKAILSDSNEAVHTSGNKSFDLKLTLSTTDNKVSPVIDLQRVSITTFENVIDRQDSAATDGFNIPLSIVQETDARGGTSAAKHITVPVTLEEPAVGLKILLSANRPDEANFDVYYKVAAGDETLNDKPYNLVAKEVELPADNDGVTFRDYEYLAGGQVGNLTPFTQFQVKIVMTTTNSSRIPRIQDLRAIALVT